jgi:hypothetical protein
MGQNQEINSSNETSKNQPDPTSILNQDLTKSLNNIGILGNIQSPIDIIKDLLTLGNDDEKNKLKTRPEELSVNDGNNNDLAWKILFGVAGLALIAASGGAGIAILAGGAAVTPILPEILKKGKEFLHGKDGDQQNISQDSLANDLPKKILALSLFEFANSGKSATADYIFNKENPPEEIKPFVGKIKDYMDSLSTISQEQRANELVSLRDEVTKIALASTQPNLFEKIDKVFLGFNEVLEGKNLEKKEGDILDELKKNLSVRSITNSDGSVTTMVSETSKKKGEEGNGGSTPSPNPASRVGESVPRADQIQKKSSASLGQ